MRLEPKPLQHLERIALAQQLVQRILAAHGEKVLAIGLVNQKCYSTQALLFQESLAFANRPDGYDALCQLVTAGNLSDFDAVATTIELFWVGLVAWAEENGFSLAKSYIAPL